jgi:hypothetical protein
MISGGDVDHAGGHVRDGNRDGNRVSDDDGLDARLRADGSEGGHTLPEERDPHTRLAVRRRRDRRRDHSWGESHGESRRVLGPSDLLRNR